MIVLALLAGMAAPVRVLEFADPTTTMVSIQAIARLPKLSERQENALGVLVDEIPRQIEGFGRRDIRLTTNGGAVHCVAGPDYIRVSFDVPRENWHAGLSLLEAIVQHSQLTPPEVVKETPPLSAWSAALRPYGHAAPKPGDVQDLYKLLFRSENLTLAVGGAVVAGQAQEDWQQKVDKWPVVRLVPPRADADPKPLDRNPGGLASIEITGPTFGPADAAIATRTLALVALGSGKGASLFRVARQNLGYGYRQEALLYPVPDGWQPRLIQVMRPTADAPKRAENLRKALLDDVEQWSDTDLRRAQGMAEAILVRNVGFSPFAFAAETSTESPLELRTFQRAYWQMKTGTPWEPEGLLKQMQSVSLADLREAAKVILINGHLRVLPG